MVSWIYQSPVPPLTLPSRLCENYLPLPISHLCEIHVCTSINCDGDIYYMGGWKSPTRMVSDMDAMFSCIFSLCDVRMRISKYLNLYYTQRLPQGSFLKKKPVSGVSFIRGGESVKEELSPHDALKHHFTSLKTDLIFLQLRVLEGKLPGNNVVIFFNF